MPRSRKQPGQRRREKATKSPGDQFSIICPRCSTAIVQGQTIAPIIAPKDLIWTVHPVLSKPVVLRGSIPTDGSPGRSDLSLGEQLRQRAAMGGKKERDELAAFESLFARTLADALVAQLRKEAADHDVDVWTWLARETGDASGRKA